MTINDNIWDEKLQDDINREATKISALSPWKTVKFEYLASAEIIHSDQRSVTEQAKFTYSPLDKAFEKQIKATNSWRSRRKTNKDAWRPRETIGWI